ncbi:hypothetical protein CPB97_007098, partial [Podila verticillata]
MSQIDNDITEPAPVPAPAPAAAPAPAPMQAAPNQAPLVAEIPDYNKMYNGYNPNRDYTFIEPQQQQPPAMQRPSARANNPPAPIHTAPIQKPSAPEIPDYNKIFTGYDPGSNYKDFEPEDQSPTMQQSPDTANNTAFITSSNTAGYGPLDHDHGMTPATHSNAPVNMNPFTGSPVTATQSGMVGSNLGRRRSSIAEFFNKVIIGDSVLDSSESPTTTFSDHILRGSASMPLPPTAPKENQGRRHSSLFTFMGFKGESDGDEHHG